MQHIAFNRTPVLYMLKMDFVVNAVLLLDLYDNHVAGVVMIWDRWGNSSKEEPPPLPTLAKIFYDMRKFGLGLQMVLKRSSSHFYTFFFVFFPAAVSFSPFIICSWLLVIVAQVIFKYVAQCALYNHHFTQLIILLFHIYVNCDCDFFVP